MNKRKSLSFTYFLIAHRYDSGAVTQHISVATWVYRYNIYTGNVVPVESTWFETGANYGSFPS